MRVCEWTGEGTPRLGDLHRVKVGLNHTLGRGRLLHLGDETRLARGRQLVLDVTAPAQVLKGETRVRETV